MPRRRHVDDGALQMTLTAAPCRRWAPALHPGAPWLCGPPATLPGGGAWTMITRALRGSPCGGRAAARDGKWRGDGVGGSGTAAHDTRGDGTRREEGGSAGRTRQRGHSRRGYGFWGPEAGALFNIDEGCTFETPFGISRAEVRPFR